MTEQERQERYKSLGDVQRHTYDLEVGTRVPWPFPRSSESHDLAEQLEILALINEAGDRGLAQSLREAAARIRALEDILRTMTRSRCSTDGNCE
jgi:hypothetical protein